LISKNKKLKAKLAETIEKTNQLKNEMDEARKAEEMRHDKDLDDLKKANQLIRVRVARPTHILFH
jgi:hypothetical protein